MATKKVAKSGNTTKWLSRYEIARKNQQSLFDDAKKNYEMLYAVIREEDYDPWRSKIFFPRLTAKIWQFIPKMVLDGGNGFRVKSRSKDSDIEGADLHEEALDYQYNNPEFDEPMFKKLTEPLMDAAVTGKGFALIPWHAERRQVKQRMTEDVIDPETGETVEKVLRLGEEKVIEFISSYNDFQPVDRFSVFYSPAGKTLQKKHWFIIEDSKTPEELKVMVDENGEEFYKNTEKLKGLKSTIDEFAEHRHARENLLNETDPIRADDTVNNVRIFHCFERIGNVIYYEVVAPDNDITIRPSAQLPYWHGKYPIQDFEIKPKPHSFEGESLFEVTGKLQRAVNSLFNHFFDSMNLSLDGMILAEENSLLSDYIVQPGGIIEYSGQKPEPWKMSEPNPNLLKIADDILSRAIDEVTVSPYAAGISNDVSDKTQGTATGILQLQKMAGEIMTYMRKCFKASIQGFGNMWLQNNQQFIDTTLYYDTVKDGKREQLEINPAKLQGMYDLVVEDELEEVTSPEEDIQKITTLVNFMKDIQAQALQQETVGQGTVDPQTGMPMPGKPLPVKVDWMEVLRTGVKALGFNETDKFILEDEAGEEGEAEMPAEMPMEMPMDGMLPPGIQPPMAPEEKPGMMDRIKGMFR